MNRRTEEPLTPYQVRLAEKEDEMFPFVGLCWVVILAVILVMMIWESALKPLLQYLGIHT